MAEHKQNNPLVIAVIIVAILSIAMLTLPFLIPLFGSIASSIAGPHGPAIVTAPHIPMTTIAVFIPMLLLLALWIAVIIWVYQDARRRGMSGLLWALLVLIGNITALLIYLIVRNDYQNITPPLSPAPARPDPCSSCGKPVSPDFHVCPYCGAPLKQTCSQCGKSVHAEWSYCPYCGNSMAGKTQR
jgi:RNA polymerase subunit RPABC4/transcription elongation factor Spt4